MPFKKYLTFFLISSLIYISLLAISLFYNFTLIFIQIIFITFLIFNIISICISGNFILNFPKNLENSQREKEWWKLNLILLTIFIIIWTTEAEMWISNNSYSFLKSAFCDLIKVFSVINIFVIFVFLRDDVNKALVNHPH